MSKINRYFDSSVAREVGTDAAIILYNLQFWIEKNQANNKHFYDGKYWTYNSIKAFQELFDWLSVQNIKTCLNKLEKQGYIITGNYNATQYDRTKWYALTNKCNVTNQPIHLLELTNGFVSSNQPIPYNNTNNKPDIINENSILKEKTSKVGFTDKENSLTYEVLEHFNQVFGKSIKNVKPFQANLVEALKVHSIDEIKLAIDNWKKDLDSPKPKFFMTEPKLPFLFRTRNKLGSCDYIDELLDLKFSQTRTVGGIEILPPLKN